MGSTIGKNIKLSLFGESHQDAVGCVIDGFPSGVNVDLDFLKAQMDKRRATSNLSTSRSESDEVIFVSGVMNNITTGAPICIMIENKNQNSKDYSKLKDLPRPSHADLTAHMKYFSHQDYRGGGHFSGRLTAPLVAAGALCLQLLKEENVKIGSHLYKMKDLKDDSFNEDIDKQIDKCNSLNFSVLNDTVSEDMQKLILEAKENCDSIGAILQTGIINLPIGVGEPYFNSLESVLSHYLFSIGGVKGVSFGLGFDYVNYYGSEVNDALYYENGYKSKTNNNGGINGGISNGMPIIIETMIKPTPSIYKTQETVNLATNENTKIEIEGRHDPCIAHRARVVIDSLCAIAVLDLLIDRKKELVFKR